MAYKRKPRWTYAQKRFLVENYGYLKDEDIAFSLGKTLKSIRKMRENLGLAKMPGRGICQVREDED